MRCVFVIQQTHILVLLHFLEQAEAVYHCFTVYSPVELSSVYG